MNGVFVVSLDFELYWGVRDIVPLSEYRTRVARLREAVPSLLELFRRYEVHATWATVGMLFFDSRGRMMEGLPSRLPRYADARYDPYRTLDEVGDNEGADPAHFAPSLIEAIRTTPYQEIGTHTFSHYYALEHGQTADDFRADLQAAQAAARRMGMEVTSIIFPRNQIGPEALSVCAELGLRAYRGTGDHWIYRGRRRGDERLLRRGLRLLDAYVSLSGDNTHGVEEIRGTPCDVVASRFLRPYSRVLSPLEALRRRRIEGEMTAAARRGRMYHLWLHPEDYGSNLERNRAFMERLLERFAVLRARYRMTSLNMAETAEQLGEHRRATTLTGTGAR